MRYFGLDISTSVIGICVIDFDKRNKAKLIYINYYKPIKHTVEDKNMDFLLMLSETKKHILCLIKKYKPDYIAVEDFIRFMSKGSGAATIIPLAMLNRTICLTVFEQYPKIPLYICNIMSIRTRIKKDIERTDLPNKEEIPGILEKLLNITIPSPMKKTRSGMKVSETRQDMADSIAVAYYCHKLLQSK